MDDGQPNICEGRRGRRKKRKQRREKRKEVMEGLNKGMKPGDEARLERRVERLMLVMDEEEKEIKGYSGRKMKGRDGGYEGGRKNPGGESKLE